MSDIHPTIYIDIETLPDGPLIDPATMTPPATMTKPETIAKWRAEQAPELAEEMYRKRALDSMKGRICCIGWAIEDGEAQAYTSGMNEAWCLLNLERVVKGLRGLPTWVGHNAQGFDMLWIWRRAIKYGLRDLAASIQLDRYRGNVRDTMMMWAGPDAYNNKVSLAALAEYLGCGEKCGGMDGSQVYGLAQAGEWDKIAEYCRRDVELTRAVYKRLTWQN